MNPRRAAFTLVEMTVALGVTAVLTVLMLRMFTDTSTIWKQHDDRLDTFREARAAIQLMARELGTVMPMTEVPDKFPVLALRNHPDTAGADKVNREIYALAAVPNSGGGDLCALGYFCQWDATKNCFILKRQFTDSNETFSRMKTILDPASPKIVQASAATPANPFPRSSFIDGGTSAFKTIYSRSTPTTLQDVASYIWNLEFVVFATLHQKNSREPVIDTVTQLPTNEVTEVEWEDKDPTYYQPYEHDLPRSVEIRFKAIGASAARKLEGQAVARETWFDPTSSAYQRLILPSEQQFVSRVRLTR